MKRILLYFVNIVNEAINNKKKYTYVNASNLIINIVICLKNQGYVISYKYYKYKLLIYLNLLKIKHIILIKLIGKRKNSIKYRNIKLCNNKQLILSSTDGIISDNYAVNNNLGGICLFYVKLCLD